MKHGFNRVGILAPNTPAFLESIYGIAAAGGELLLFSSCTLAKISLALGDL